jgi:hypothetical protein
MLTFEISNDLYPGEKLCLTKYLNDLIFVLWYILKYGFETLVFFLFFLI